MSLPPHPLTICMNAPRTVERCWVRLGEDFAEQANFVTVYGGGALTLASVANTSEQLVTTIDANAFSSKHILGHRLKVCVPVCSLGTRPY